MRSLAHPATLENVAYAETTGLHILSQREIIRIIRFIRRQ